MWCCVLWVLAEAWILFLLVPHCNSPATGCRTILELSPYPAKQWNAQPMSYHLLFYFHPFLHCLSLLLPLATCTPLVCSLFYSSKCTEFLDERWLLCRIPSLSYGESPQFFFFLMVICFLILVLWAHPALLGSYSWLCAQSLEAHMWLLGLTLGQPCVRQTP